MGFLIFFLSTYLFAAEHLLDPYVITGTRTQKLISDAPVKTEVVTEKDIIENEYDDLGEVIQRIPGVSLNSITGRSGFSPVLQGLSRRLVLVMVDGVPVLQRGSSGYDLSQIDIRRVKRVEVIKGGASSLYGSQAVGGVINVLTKEPDREVGFFVNLKLTSFEQNDLQKNKFPSKLNLGFSKGFGDHKFRFNLSRRKRGRFDLNKFSIAEDAFAIERYNTGVGWVYKPSLRHTYRLDYDFLTEDTEQSVSVPTPQSFEPRKNNTKALAHTLSFFHSSKWKNDLNSELKLNYKLANEDFILGDNPKTSFIESLKFAEQNSFRVEPQLDKLMFKRHLLSLGGLFNYEFLEQKNTVNVSGAPSDRVEIADKSTHSTEFYLQDNIIFDRLEVTPGFRGQFNKGYGFHKSYTLNTIYSPKSLSDYKTNFRFSVGTGFRSPSLKELYYLLDHRNFGYILKGNKDLRPEASNSYQLGFEVIKNKTYSLSLNSFLNKVDDLIGSKITGTDSQGNLKFEYINFKKVKTYGTEFNFTYFANAKLKWTSNFSYLRAKDTFANKVLPMRPRYNFFNSISYRPFSKLQLIAEHRFIGRQYSDQLNKKILDDISLMGLRVNYSADKNWRFYSGVENVFNVRKTPALDSNQVSFDGRPVWGRSFYVGCEYRLN